MPIHNVQQGECISSIAEQYGFFPETVWSDAANAELRSKRGHANALAPGDQLTIPEKRVKKVSVKTNAVHKFVRRGVPAMLRLNLEDQGKPLAGQPFELIVDGQSTTGTTSQSGEIQVPIPPSAKTGTLKVGSGDAQKTYNLKLGELDPQDTMTGAQARLRNLGYDCGAIDDQSGPKTEAALKAFQKSVGLEPTGELNATTQQKLQEVHDG